MLFLKLYTGPAKGPVFFSLNLSEGPAKCPAVFFNSKFLRDLQRALALRCLTVVPLSMEDVLEESY